MSTQNAAKAVSVQPEDKEKEILNKYTDLCIRKKDRWKKLREEFERNTMMCRPPYSERSDCKIEDEKIMEDMLKLYMSMREKK